ncbi:hypothetical protein FZEAL_6402 [Fusarium zealandicum]|uniref:Rhodopsin domain-containing protein n=1 Tax=Fusarium zealandicum TaxID=1053134 RepID=A0A8H4XJY0_9HYPO|nr:hypothetical protein FZEAL_6402 [Fusarium zealandicum]
MKFASWAVCSLLLTTGVYGAHGSDSCVSRCLKSSYRTLVRDTGNTTTALCNTGDENDEVNECISRTCTALARFKTMEIQAQACHPNLESRHTMHYVLLAAEIPAWFGPWLRLYSSCVRGDGFALDDQCMLVCGILYTVFAALIHLALFVASDITSGDTDAVTNGLKLVYIAEIFELACLCLSRVTILVLCLRVFPVTRHKIATYAAMALIVAFSIILAFLRIFRCSPIEFAWDVWSDELQDGRCLDREMLAYLAAGFDAAFNVVILAALLLFIRRLPTDIAVMMTMAVMLALSMFALAVSCFRLWHAVDLVSKMTPVWDYRTRLIWMDVEVSALIIVACLPSIWPTFTSVTEPEDIECADRPLSSRLETGRSGSTETATVRLRASLSRLRRAKSPPLLTGDRRRKKVEHRLHLGDKIKGNVRTEIEGGPRASMISQVGERIGIRVKTTTTTQVDVGRRDAENR